MIKLIILSFILFSTKGFCQLSKSEKVLLDIFLNKTIKNENQTYLTNLATTTERQTDDGSTLTEETPVIDTVKADLVVNHEEEHGENQIYIKSAKAVVRGDTLDILLFNHSSYIFWEYRILIVKDTYQIETWFIPPINEKKIQILPITTVLKINTLDFSKGNELIGYTNLMGQCKGDNRSCFTSDIAIEGKFKVKIE